MKFPLTVFIPYKGNTNIHNTANSVRSSKLIEEIYLITGESVEIPKTYQYVNSENILSTGTLKTIAGETDSEFILLILKPLDIVFEKYSLNRFLEVAELTGAGLVYSDYCESDERGLTAHPQIDYQSGSLRDDFDFGEVLLIRKSALEDFLSRSEPDFMYAGLYNLRLYISRNSSIIRIPELLYTVKIEAVSGSGENNFNYVDPGNRAAQVEMEEVVTAHLKQTGAYLDPVFSAVNITDEGFAYTASVVIPVKNRAKTIVEAVNSALNQETDFAYNIIIVDNHSTDGTTGIIKSLSEKHSKIIHIVPSSNGLEIGGCWNEAIFNDHCGQYAVQLDSDDLYADNTTLQKIINVFRLEKSAMVIGSYKLTDFNLNDLPPGIISHNEWTPANGRNNALRINGLGAPRAFYTPLIRKIKFPNVSYGEDYSVALAVSRKYEISRIYEPLYICRRWEGNSDASLPVEKKNRFNFYKDTIRTYEIKARQKLNAETR